MTTRGTWQDVRTAFDVDARGRQELLEAPGIHGSNRDPLAEFRERLGAALLNGELATNRVQRGWDLTAAGRRVQVKCLANSTDRWVGVRIFDLGDVADQGLAATEAVTTSPEDEG